MPQIPYTLPTPLGGSESGQGNGSAAGHYGWRGKFAKGLVYAVDTFNPASNPDLDALQELMLQSTDITERAIAADRIADYKTFRDPTWVITICDMLWRPWGELGDDLMEMVGTDPRNNVPTATLKIKGGSRFVRHFQDCKNTMVGIIVETAGLRMTYYVDSFDWEYRDGQWIGTANCLGIWDVLNYILVWPNFLSPIQAQIPSHAVFIWGLVTVITVMIAEQATRLQAGIWEFINNALSFNPDIRAWFGTFLLAHGNSLLDILRTPVYVSGINPLFDTSPIVARTVRMESCGQVIQDITRAYGVDVRVDLWLPGDPQPDVWTEIPGLGLTQPTYVVKVYDRSQIEGPTKTILDSVLRLIVDVEGSFFGDIEPYIMGVPGMSGVYYSPMLGVNYVQPWAIVVAPDQGEKGSVVSCKMSFHTPKGWQHIIGGRSPKWLNDLFNAFFGWIIDAISILLGFIGIPSNLLDGLLNNVFLAFQLIEHFGRRAAVGPYHPCIEVIHPTPSAPYNIETLFGFINALWDSRGYVSGQFEFRDGVVYKLGKDIFRGGLISLVYDGRRRMFTDYVENIMFRYTPTERDIMVQVGDGKAEEAPMAKHQRFITSAFEAVNVLLFSPQA